MQLSSLSCFINAQVKEIQTEKGKGTCKEQLVVLLGLKVQVHCESRSDQLLWIVRR